MPEHTNRLIHETSPYLLQHAHNPVQWFAWGEEALNKAKEEDKPILVSIGYSACHWCHVMEKESFEDEATAAIMNEHFINIKIDREERPDLDNIYMDAVQAMTGSGGWPLNVFLTPAAKPFYGGTYFPPRKAFNRPSWKDVLGGVAQSFREKRDEIDQQAEQMTQHLLRSNSFGIQEISDALFNKERVVEIAENLMKTADREWGGFGGAPKFPQTFSIIYLLRYHYIYTRGSAEPVTGGALEQALLSLDRMIEGGIYDQVGGGFARYSTDREWLAPHFEKMLYDNALLLIALAEAYQFTGKARYREVIAETMEFVRRELTLPASPDQQGFYAALDADSEGEEGKFYVWEWQEVQELLGNDSSLFCDYYDVTNHGNWEGHSILRARESIEKLAARNGISTQELAVILAEGKKKLLKEREKRIRPQLDDKIILGWNALMNTACSKAFAATGDETYRILAINNMQFLLQRFEGKAPHEFYHTWKNDQAKYPAFLDDYANLIQALIQLQEITGNVHWLNKAKEITGFVIDQFGEEETGFFFYTRLGQEDVIVRKKELYDGAVPSGNSVMAANLYRLSIYFDKGDWRERSRTMLSSLEKAVTRYPGSFGNWASLLLEMVEGTEEIAITGKDLAGVHEELLKEYLPHRVLMVAAAPENGYPLLAGKAVTGSPSIWLCRNFRCLSPVGSVKVLMRLINSPEGRN